MKVLFSIISRIILVVLSFSLAIFLIETGLKITNYQKKELAFRWAIERKKDIRPLFAIHPQRIYAMNKNIGNSEKYYYPLWASDKYGFRYNPSHKNDISYKKSIIMVGDSFTFGFKLEDINDAYPARVEKQLRSAGENVIVYNAGIPGYGLDQEFLYIRDELINHRPDMLVWNINVNDLFDSNETCLFKEKARQFLSGFLYLGSFRQCSYL